MRGAFQDSGTVRSYKINKDQGIKKGTYNCGLYIRIVGFVQEGVIEVVKVCFPL